MNPYLVIVVVIALGFGLLGFMYWENLKDLRRFFPWKDLGGASIAIGVLLLAGTFCILTTAPTLMAMFRAILFR